MPPTSRKYLQVDQYALFICIHRSTIWRYPFDWWHNLFWLQFVCWKMALRYLFACEPHRKQRFLSYSRFNDFPPIRNHKLWLPCSRCCHPYCRVGYCYRLLATTTVVFYLSQLAFGSLSGVIIAADVGAGPRHAWALRRTILNFVAPT